MLSLKSVKCHPLLLPSLVQDGSLTYSDISIQGCDGHSATSQRFLLAACSPLLCSALADVPVPSPACVILPDTPDSAIQHLLQLIHTDEKLLDKTSYWDLLELMTLLNIDYTNNFYVIEPQVDSFDQTGSDFQQNSDFSVDFESGQILAYHSTDVINQETAAFITNQFDSTRGSSLKRETVVPSTHSGINHSMKVECAESHISGEQLLAVNETGSIRVQGESEPIMHACQHCEKCFSSGEHLEKHIKSKHERHGCFRCMQCPFRTNSKTSLNNHTKTVHDRELNYQCDYCSRKFSDKSNLNKHRANVHLKQKPYQCSFCDQSFAQKVNLSTHIRRHTGEKPFCCDLCGKSFAQVSSLNSHKLTH